jgi:predicted dehydrogenase
MSQRVRVAVAGLGIGKSHIAAYRCQPDKFDVAAVCDVDGARARDVAAATGVTRVFNDLDDVLRLADIDVVDLCTPPGAHFLQIQQVLAAGKHCICEKPLVGSLREVDALIAAEKRSGKRMMPIFQYRYGHGLQKLLLLHERGLTGTPYVATVETHWRRRSDYYKTPWRGKWESDLGGMLNGLTIHLLDALMNLLGRAHSVYAMTATKVNPIEVEDCSAATLQMENGCLVTVSATLGSVAQISRLRFVFSNLVAESNTQPYNCSTEPWTYTGDTPELDEQIKHALSEFQPQPERFEGQFIGFYEALREGTPPPVTLADARRAIELITALYKSAQTNRPVTLPLRRNKWYMGWRPD